MSFGHLSSMPSKPSFSSARATATPTASDSPARKPAPCSKRQPIENVIEPAGDGGPRAAAATASGGLPFGGEHRAVDVATRRAAQELGRRRIELVGHLDLQRRRRAVERRGGRGRSAPGPLRPEPAASGAGVPGFATLAPNPVSARRTAAASRKSGAVFEPVAETADALEREPGRLGLPQELRNPGARQPHLRGEVLARVEVAVRQLAQQRETERSKH